MITTVKYEYEVFLLYLGRIDHKLELATLLRENDTTCSGKHHVVVSRRCTKYIQDVLPRPSMLHSTSNCQMLVPLQLTLRSNAARSMSRFVTARIFALNTASSSAAFSTTRQVDEVQHSLHNVPSVSTVSSRPFEALSAKLEQSAKLSAEITSRQDKLTSDTASRLDMFGTRQVAAVAIVVTCVVAVTGFIGT